MHSLAHSRLAHQTQRDRLARASQKATARSVMPAVARRFKRPGIAVGQVRHVAPPSTAITPMYGGQSAHRFASISNQ
jgi:hypothetical protein